MDSDEVNRIVAIKNVLESGSDIGDDKILRALKRLNQVEMTVELLQNTGIGKVVNQFRKSDGQIGPFAKFLVNKWKQNVAKLMAQSQETNGVSENNEPSETDAQAEIQADDHIPSNDSAKEETKSDDDHTRKDHQNKSDSKSDSSSRRKSSKEESNKKKSSDKHLSHERSSSHNHKTSSKHESNSNETSKREEKDRHISSQRKDDKSSSKSHESRHHSTKSESSHKSSKSDSSHGHRSSKSDSSHKNSDGSHKSSHDSSRKHHSSSTSNHERSSSDKPRDKSSSRHDSSKSSSHRSKDSSSKHHSDKSHRSRDHDSKKDKSEPNLNNNTESSQTSAGESSGSEARIRRKKSTERRSTLPQFHVPAPQPSISLQEIDILASLPQTVTNYKPLPHVSAESPHKRRATEEEIGTKKHSRSVMYSGKKSRTVPQVPRLYDACMEVLMDNIDNIDYVGGTPYFILKPLLEKCSSKQLYNLENFNPHLLEDSDEIWQDHCRREFRGKTRNMDDCETWRELYLRLHDEREYKLKKLTANISKQHTKLNDAGRKTKLAFVETLAKPPRDVLRKQQKYGTGGPVHKRVDPLERLESHGGKPGSSSIRPPIMRNQATNEAVSPPVVKPAAKKPSTAPMMASAMRMMKKMRR